MKLLVGNWKMNLGPSAARDFSGSILPLVSGLKKTDVWVTPPFISIPTVTEIFKSSKIKVGAQNVHWEETGAFTGEISPGMLKECGVSYAVVGHSERRHVFGESSEMAAKRAVGALKAGITVVFCVGETLTEREQSITGNVIKSQLEPLTKLLAPDITAELIIAYEPVWAIGTGKVASISDISSTLDIVKEHWITLTRSSKLPRLLYGGSVDPTNAEAILKVEMVAGCLVGGASINRDKLAKLISIFEEV